MVVTVEEHRRLGGNPDVDRCLSIHDVLEEDDAYLSEVNASFRSGDLLAGEMKAIVH